MISAILLAAGESKRMGRPKQLLPLGETTMVERAIDNLLGAGVGEVIVVVGYRAPEIIKKIASKPVKIAANQAYQQGMSTSIIAGLKLVDEGAGAVMLALADQPLVDSQTVSRLISEFGSHHEGIAIPTYQGQRGHPVIFSIRYREELSRLKGDIGGRQIVSDHPDDILEVAVDSPAVVSDIDTADDYHFHLA